MSPADREHLWASEHLDMFATGLMQDEDLNRFEQHLAACDECRGTVHALAAPEANRGMHIPDALIARWPTTRTTLRGLQRELARRHLATCEECRSILRYRGQSLELERVPGLEPSAEALAALDGLAPSLPGSLGQRTVELPRPRFNLREFLFGGAVGGLVAAAAALAIVSTLSLHPAQHPTPANPGVPALRLELGGGAAVRTLGSIEAGNLVRGGRGDTTITLAPGQSRVRIALAPEPDLAPETQVELELRDAGGALLMHTSMPYSYLIESDRGLAIASDGALPETDLTLLLTWTATTGTRHTVHYLVDLRR